MGEKKYAMNGCRFIQAILFLLIVHGSVAQQAISKVWVADNGNGIYKNPVIHADYSDPDAIRVGDDYYMVSSSFTQIPGLPILHSTDMVNWTLIGHALKRLQPHEHFNTVQHGGGVWAPSIRYHNGVFYIYYPDPDFGIYLTTAKNITGPWSDPVMVEGGRGLIDPCPLWDDDGKAYLVHAYAGSRAGIKSIIVVKEMDASGTKTTSDGVMVYDGHEKDPTIEGPKFYKRHGYYYIFAPAGGVSTGWQTVLRSRNIYGPYERRVVLDQGSTIVNGPHQGAWVDTKTGEDWFLHFQDKDAYGRVVHLQPMKWINDWPVIGVDKDGDGRGEPVLLYKKPNTGKAAPVATPADTDEFNTPIRGLQWQWQANPQEGWAFSTGTGLLRMFSVYQPDSVNSLWDLPNILGQKLPAESFTATVKFNFKPKFDGERFGLVLFGTDYAYISIIKKEEGLFVVCAENKQADKNNKEATLNSLPIKGNDFYLRIKMMAHGHYQLAFSGNDGQFTTIAQSFIAKPGRWVGARLGMFCIRTNITNDAGFADIDWFRVDP